MIRHGLGKNKGGEWVQGNGCSSRVNKRLYDKMMSPRLIPLQNKTGTDKICAWKRSGWFLDSDVSVAYKFQRVDGKVMCENCDQPLDGKKNRTLANCCEKAEGYDQVQEYRSDNDKFVLDFAKAMQKMINHGQENLETVDYKGPQSPLFSKPKAPNPRKMKKKKNRRRGKKGDEMISNDVFEKVENILSEVRDEIDDIKENLVH